jgi:hypothetical protein
MSTFKQQYLTMFVASEQEFFDMLLTNPKTKLSISAAASVVPREAIGYCDTLLRNPAANVASDAISQIRRHVPDFLAGEC